MFGLESNFYASIMLARPVSLKNLAGSLTANNFKAHYLPPNDENFFAIGKFQSAENPALNAKVRHITY
jgi:hypothetical protein